MASRPDQAHKCSFSSLRVDFTKYKNYSVLLRIKTRDELVGTSTATHVSYWLLSLPQNVSVETDKVDEVKLRKQLEVVEGCILYFMLI